MMLASAFDFHPKNLREPVDVADAMSDLLPEDVHERLQGRCYIAVTQLEPRVQPLLLDTFTSKDDLIGALLCSCFIPFWLDGRSATRRYRDAAHADGGFTNFLPVPPRRPEERLVRVSCFNTSAWPAFNDIEESDRQDFGEVKEALHGCA